MAEPAIEPIPQDERGAVRHRTLLGGKLVYGEGAFSIDCVVRDISDTGARVQVPEGQAVPDRLWLVELRSGVAYEAQVTWKRHPHLGLKFIHQHGLAEASTPHLLILKHLWTESRQRSGVSTE